MTRYRLLVALALAAMLLPACAAPAAPPAPSSGAPPAAATAAPPSAAAPSVAPAATAAGAAAAPAAPAAPAVALPTSPVVDLDVGVLPLALFGAVFVANDKGFFREAGLNVNLQPFGSVLESLPALAQGRLHIAGGASSAAFYNAFSRQTDTLIVADLASAGKTEKSIGYNSLVVRKDLWDSGVIRGPQDLVGRKVYVIATEGGSQLQVIRWLRANGIDERLVEFEGMQFPDMFAAMKNRAIELASTTEPFVTQGVNDGTHVVLATQEEMYPTTQILFLMYAKNIDSLGPQVGTRFMTAYLRGARAYIQAFEQGADLDAVAQILADHTIIKDPNVFKRIKYGWVDPNGVPNRQAIEAEAALFRELGIIRGEVDMAGQFEDRYRQEAVAILGESTLP